MFLVAITKTNKFEVSYDEKKTTATTQPKMRGKTKMDIKRNLCFLFDVETMTILPFNFVVFTCFYLQCYKPSCTATLNHANTFHRTHHMCLILYHHFFNGNAKSDRSGVLTPFIQYPIFCFRYLYMSQQNA